MAATTEDFYGWMDGWIDGWMDGWMDGLMVLWWQVIYLINQQCLSVLLLWQ